MVAFVCAADRKTKRREAHPYDFGGILQLTAMVLIQMARCHQQIRLAFCWAYCAASSTTWPKARRR